MKRIFLFLAISVAGFSTIAQKVWKADPNHSKLTFTISHWGVSDVAGLFKTFEGTITATKDDFSDAVFEVVAQTNSVNTEVEKRDNHLKSPDFFEVDKFPTMTFKSTSITKVSDGKYTLTGDFTLHGVTKPITLNLWYRGTIQNPMSKSDIAGFQVTGVVKRSDFAFGSKFTAPMLGDEVQIKADGEFSPAK